ncbi:hypothetical protein JCM11641_008434 [Rhodosporidiobolus odoratus]
MSDEEFQDFPSDDENAYDSDLYIEDDHQPQQPQQPQPQQPARVSRYQPPPAPTGDETDGDENDYGMGLGGGRYAAAAGGSGLRRYLNPAAFQAGFGGHAFARPPASAFRRQYRAYSTAILEIQQGRDPGTGRSNLMFGGKIVMPPSALEELTQLDIELPITFELTNPLNAELNTHVGVLEFIADEGCVNLPQWIMDQLRLNEGDPIRLVGGRYPKGKHVKIQAQSVDFLEVSDPKALLETAFRNYSCVSAGDIIEVGYHSLTFRLLVMEVEPAGPAISVIDTDLEVEFAPPLGYVEPEYKKPSELLPKMSDKFKIDTQRKEDYSASTRGSGANTPIGGKGKGKEEGAPVDPWEAFKGSGNSLGGKRVKGKGVKARAIEEVDENSRIFRTDQPRIITADTELSPRTVPAALNLPFGALFFGYDRSNAQPPPGSDAEAQQKAAEAAEKDAQAAPFAGLSGNGATLSGRQRAAASLPGGSATAAGQPPAAGIRASGQPEEKPQVPFSGQGNTLSGKKPVETIEID